MKLASPVGIAPHSWLDNVTSQPTALPLRGQKLGVALLSTDPKGTRTPSVRGSNPTAYNSRPAAHPWHGCLKLLVLFGVRAKDLNLGQNGGSPLTRIQGIFTDMNWRP